MSVSHDRVGDVKAGAGDLAAAYQSALDITARLAAADPTNSEWLRDLSVTQQMIENLASIAKDA